MRIGPVISGVLVAAIVGDIALAVRTSAGGSGSNPSCMLRGGI